MEYSKKGLELTESFEGCKLEAYKDVVGIWTIGYGHTGPEVIPGLVIDQATAERFLKIDINSAISCVNSCVSAPITQGEFDALVDFVFNVGCSSFRRSTMLRMLNDGQYADAAKQFGLWAYASGKAVAGLLRRREAEAREFDTV